jgi:hypothetical protein
MKKAAILFFVCAAPFLGFGQPLRYGFTLGVNSADTHSLIARLVKTYRVAGANAGLKVQYELTPHWYLHAAPAYSQKGMKMRTSALSAPPYIAEVPAVLSLDYIDFPLLISPVAILNCVKLYPMAGIEQSILVRAANKAAYVDDNNTVGVRTTNILKADTPDYFYKEARFNRYNIALTAGLGIQFNTFARHIAFLEARFAYGLNRALTAPTGTGVHMKNNVLSFNTGLLF